MTPSSEPISKKPSRIVSEVGDSRAERRTRFVRYALEPGLRPVSRVACGYVDVDTRGRAPAWGHSAGFRRS